MPSKTEKTAASPVRHAVARSTGATTWARRISEDGIWIVTCLNHGIDAATPPNRGAAWKVGSHPQDFCPKCKNIMFGKAEKITGDRLEIPTAEPKPKATDKAPARKRSSRTAA